jgi:hypothetical protein
MFFHYLIYMRSKKNLIAFLFIGLFAYPITANNVPFETPHSLTSVDKIYTEFNDGWEEGFCEGWKDIKGNYSICPITPIAPIPRIGESSDSFRDGYNRGFKYGMCKARDGRCSK